MVEVEILSGAKSIGGNFIKIKDKDEALVFDQGIRFDVMSAFYSGFVSPRGLQELREIGAVPKAEWYEGVRAIYISHMHLDHLGLLSNIPKRLRVHLPSLSVYEILEERWRLSSTWLSMVPRKHYVEIKESRPLEVDENDVMPLPVSHSAYPANALLYFGSDEVVLYTGDVRVEGFLTSDEFAELRGGKSMLDYLGENKDIRIDRLIIEGTNLGSIGMPLSPRDEEVVLGKVLNAHSLAIATIHPIDLEYAAFLCKMASQHGRSLCLASNTIAKLMECIEWAEIKAISDYAEGSRFETIELSDVKENSIVVTSYHEIIDLIRDLKGEGVLPKWSAAILNEPEPRIEEAQEYDVIVNWFLKLGVQAYVMRVSGHYYPHQFKAMINAIKPRKIELIHTKARSEDFLDF